MANSPTIDQATCNACGLCAEVCPIQIMKKDGSGRITFRPDRQPLCMRCGQCMAICPACSIAVEGLSYGRDFFELPGPVGVDSGFFDLIATRRSIRNFANKPVPREVLAKIVAAMAYAPPGFTPIKTEVVVVQDTGIIRQALPHMIKVYEALVGAMGQPIPRWFIRRELGAAKFKTVQTHLVPLMQTRLPELKQGTEDTITRGAPAMIVLHASRTAENYEADICIALTYGLLAAHALGLGATAIELIPPAIEHSAGLRTLLSIPDDHHAVASMILGYPKYRYQRGIRRALKSVAWI